MKARGAVLVDLDPSTPELEAITAGYDNRIVALRPNGSEWTASVVLVDTDKFHHVASGQFDTDPALEAIACGFTGRIYRIDWIPGD